MNTKAKAQVDPIIEEIHEFRRQIAARFDFDSHLISEAARRRQREEGRAVWQPTSPNKPVNPSGETGQT